MENKKQLLNIGDKLYYKNYPRYSNLSGVYNYISAEVVRLTKTQAILSNGKKLINEPVNASIYTNKWVTGYCVFGDRWEKYLFETDESIADAKIQKQRIVIHNWFNNKTFTEEERTKIYNLLNK